MNSLCTNSYCVILALFWLACSAIAQAQAPPAPNEKLNVADFIAKLRDDSPPPPFTRQHKFDHPEKAGVVCMDFAGDMSALAASYANGDVLIWDLKTAKSLQLKRADNAEKSELALCMSESGKYLLVGGEVYEWRDNKPISHAPKMPTKRDKVFITKDDKYAVFFAPPQHILRAPLAGGEGQTLTLKNETRFKIATINARGSILSFFRDDKLELGHFFLTPENAKGGNGSQAIKVPLAAIAATDKYILMVDVRGGFTVIWIHVPEMGEPQAATESAYSSIDRSGSFIDVTRDGRYAFLADEGGDCELRDLRGPGKAHRYFFQPAKIAAWSLGDDGKSLAIGSKEGSIAIMQLPHPPVNLAMYAASALQRLTSTKDYDSLEQIFAAFEQEHRPLLWQPNRAPYEALGDLLFYNGGAPGALQLAEMPVLKQWIEARPNAVAPKLLLARHYINVAWQIRGSGFAATVRPESWAGFHKHIDLAEKILSPIAETPKPPPFVWTQLFRVVTAQSWEKERWEPHANKLREQAPQYVDAHKQLLVHLMPRWGGGPTDVHDYAAKIADTVGGLDGDALYARLAHSQRPFMGTWEQFDEVGFYRPRLMNGWEHLAKTATDRVYCANVGLFFAAGYDDRESAAKIFKQLPASQNPRTLWDFGVWRFEIMAHPLFHGKPYPPKKTEPDA